MLGLGERLSEHAPRLAARVLPHGDGALSEDGRLWGKFTAAASKDAKATLEEYARLPERLQRDPTAMLLWLRCATGLSDEEYREALADFRRLFPDHPGAELVAIGAWFARGEPREALGAIERLDKAVGDPYLGVLAASARKLAGEPAQAKAALRSAIAREPTLAEAHYVLLDIVLGERDWAEAKRLLIALEEGCGIRMQDDLSELLPYREFAKSAEYREWQARRPAHPEGPSSRAATRRK
jgi:tetratricopeptide (TPR) repeat protein